MRGRIASITSRHQVPWLRRHGFAVRLGSCFVSVALAAGLLRTVSVASLIWVANGVLLAFVLLASRRRWSAYLSTGFAAQIAASALAGLAWRTNLLLSALNLLEVFLCAFLLRKASKAPPRFTDRGYVIRFILFGVVAGPLATGVLVAALAALFPRLALGSTALEWIASDCLGVGIATPVCMAILRGNFRNTFSARKGWVYLLLLAAVTLAAFWQTRLPLLFILYPLLVLVLLRMGMGWAALSTLMVALMGSWCAIHGQGPFVQSRPLTPMEPSILLQVFVGCGVFLLYTISYVLEREQSIMRELERLTALHALVSENSRDAIILADLSGHRSYVSSAAESLGWKPEDLLTQDGFAMVHPEDQQRAQAIVSGLNSGAEGAMIECRIQKPGAVGGEYIWVEASLRMVRNSATGAPSGILNVVRDVTERKIAELRLQEAYNAVEALAVTDALTGLANRRRFDQYLGTEWRRSMRDRQPLSLLMMDVDKFKTYNDTYGHQRGDSCLKQIAEACMDVVSRPGDLVARFGGEEFVVVLPNTESEGAVHIAEEICEALRGRRLPHSGNLPGIITISVGCATLIPKFGKHAPDLIELADKALYQAKAEGRNRVCNGNLIAGDATTPAEADPAKMA